jgi:multimeric flavodoxin WrbA
MKVLLFNGSPHREGNTAIALEEVARTLDAKGIETEIIQVGGKTIAGCIACGKCMENGNRCVFDDIVNASLDKVEEADGFVFASPVYYASPNGTMLAFMDRLFYAGSQYLAFKPGASVAVARRGGTSATYDVLNKYIGISNMIMVPSNYWNNVHGGASGDAAQDLEGLQTMRILGTNMAWLLRLIESGIANGLPHPTPEAKVKFNYVR